MKRIGIVLLALVALVVFACPATMLFAGDIPGVSAADFESPEAKAIWSILAGQGPWGALLFGIIAVLYAIFKPMISAWVKSKVSDSHATFIANLYNIVEAGVLGVKQTYTDVVKAASADGKLTEDEVKEAKARCRQFVIDHFKAQGVDILKEYGHAALDMLIEAVLARFKMDNPVVRAVALPLPDLAPSAPSV